MAKVAVLNSGRLMRQKEGLGSYPAGYFSFATEARALVDEAAASRVSAVLLALDDVAPAVLPPVCVELRERAPGVAVFAYTAKVGAVVPPHPVAGVFVGTFDDVVRNIGALIVARDLAATPRIMRVVRRRVPAVLHRFIELALADSGHHPTVEHLARVAGIAHRTLTERLRRAGLPDAREFVSWCRVLLAAHALEYSGHSITRIADAQGFSSDGALRTMIRRRIAFTPSQLRTAGGFERALARLETVLSDTTAAPDRASRPGSS